MATRKMPMKIIGLAPTLKKNSVNETPNFFSFRSEKKFMATRVKVGSVFNSPFQNSLQEKRTRKFIFSFLQSC
jgi:hypothetical protein